MQIKINKKDTVRDYVLILVGSLILATAYVFFITPYKIIPGGIYGIAIVLHYITQGIVPFLPDGLPIGTTALCFNIPLLYVSYRLLGAKSITKTIVTFVSTSVFTDSLSLLKGDRELFSDDPLLASIYGGVLIGLGVALIFKAHATSAGSDVMAKMLTKYQRVPLSYSIILVDSTIVLLGLIAFRDWAIPLYSWITIFVYGEVVAAIQQGLSNERAVFIISSKSEEIGQMVNQKLKRGGTYFHGRGIYNGKEQDIVYTVVKIRQLPMLREHILAIDEHAFITVLSAHEAFGQGFKSLKETIND
ncbi:membrane protein [Bacteroidia bacterium]|nr:membrane protein [Bacteroidia bacterium]